MSETAGEKRAADSENGSVPESYNETEPESKKLKHDDQDLVQKDVNGKESNGNHAKVHDHATGTLTKSEDVRAEMSSQAVHGKDGFHMQEVVEQVYQMKMPKDFYNFWNFCCRTNPMNPRMALSAANIELVGPFDILAGDVDCEPSKIAHLQELALLHWRYYYDVPEMQTCLKVTGPSQLHFGYFRDDPTELPIFVGSNEAANGCKIEDSGQNLFAVVHELISEALKEAKDEAGGLKELLDMVKLHAQQFHHPIGKSVHTRAHRGKIISDALHGAGISVGKNDAHHASLASIPDFFEGNGEAGVDAFFKGFGEKGDKDTTEKLEQLQELVNKKYEEELGIALELGIDLFCCGHKRLDASAKSNLVKAYGLLKRDLFEAIAAKHMDHRAHGDQLRKFHLKGN